MRYFLTLVCIFSIIYSYSQETLLFNNNYQNEDGTGNWISSSLAIYDGKYIINGGYSDTLNGCSSYWSRGVFIATIDSTGELTEKRYSANCENALYEGLNKSMTANNESIAFVVMKDSSDLITTSIDLCVFDNYLDTVFVQNYLLDTTTKRAWGLTNTSDGGWAIIGSNDTTHSEHNLTSTYVQVLLLKLDSVGNVMWQKKYKYQENENYTYNFGTNVIETYDKGFTTIGISAAQNSFSKNLLIKTDSLGNEEWHQIRGSSSYSNPLFTDIIETRDSCILVCGAYTYGETYGGLYPYDGWLIKLNPDGSTVWNRKFRDSISSGSSNDFYAYYKAITEKENGEIIATLKTKSDINGEYIGNKFRLRCHYPNGDIKWDKVIDSIGGSTGSFEPTSIALDENENIIISGYGDIYYLDVNDDWTYDQRIFLIKTDSLGNDHFVSVSEPQAKPITRYELVVYPNPASDYLLIETDENSQANGELTIVNQSGQMVYQNHVTKDALSSGICVSDFTPGNYLIQLKTEDKTFFGKFVKVE